VFNHSIYVFLRSPQGLTDFALNKKEKKPKDFAMCVAESKR
jgi:hypothetical protein